MPWFRVDDTFPLHAKVMAAGNGAVGLWTRAGAWSMQQLTDGFVPTHVARTLGTAAEAKRLVAAGLWREMEGGYTFHEWEERQPSREKVEADRHAAAERQRVARERAKSRRESQQQSRRDEGVSHGPPDPTRPDPTRSSYGTTTPASAGGPGGEAAEPARSAAADGSARKRASALPEDFEPNDTNRRLADERGLDLSAVVAHFTDHHLAKGSTFVDWQRALSTWIRREKPQAPTSRPRALTNVHELERPPDGLSPEEYAEWEYAQRQKRGRA